MCNCHVKHVFYLVTYFLSPGFFSNDSRTFPELPACFASGRVYECFCARTDDGVNQWLIFSLLARIYLDMFYFSPGTLAPPPPCMLPAVNSLLNERKM